MHNTNLLITVENRLTHTHTYLLVVVHNPIGLGLGLGLGLGIRFKVPVSEWTFLRTPITCQGNASEGLSMHTARNQYGVEVNFPTYPQQQVWVRFEPEPRDAETTRRPNPLRHPRPT